MKLVSVIKGRKKKKNQDDFETICLGNQRTEERDFKRNKSSGSQLPTDLCSLASGQLLLIYTLPRDELDMDNKPNTEQGNVILVLTLPLSAISLFSHLNEGIGGKKITSTIWF